MQVSESHQQEGPSIRWGDVDSGLLEVHRLAGCRELSGSPNRSEPELDVQLRLPREPET